MTSIEMLPDFALDDSVNERRGDSVLFGEVPHTRPVVNSDLWSSAGTRLVRRADRTDFIIGEFYSGIIGSLETDVGRISLATFRHHVVYIFSRRPYKQMCRIAAWPIVTLVAYVKSRWDWAIGQFVGEPVRPVLFPKVGYPSVSCLFNRASPRPTSVFPSTLVNPRPESFSHGDSYELPILTLVSRHTMNNSTKVLICA